MSFFAGVMVICAVILAASVCACELQSRLELVCVAYGMLIGFGAYSYALVVGQIGSPFLGLVAAAAVSGIAGGALVLISSRTVSDDFALITFALQIAWGASITLSRPLTGGVLGISGIENVPLSSVVGHEVGPLLVLLLLLCLQLVALWRIEKSGVVAACAVISRSRQLANTLDIASTAVRIGAGAFVGASMGVAGGVWAGFLSFIEPRMFGVSLSVMVLSVAFFGVSQRWQLLAGITMIVALPQAMRLFDIPTARTGYVQLMIAGACLFGGTCVIFKSASTRERPDI